MIFQLKDFCGQLEALPKLGSRVTIIMRCVKIKDKINHMKILRRSHRQTKFIQLNFNPALLDSFTPQVRGYHPFQTDPDDDKPLSALPWPDLSVLCALSKQAEEVSPGLAFALLISTNANDRLRLSLQGKSAMRWEWKIFVEGKVVFP